MSLKKTLSLRMGIVHKLGKVIDAAAKKPPFLIVHPSKSGGQGLGLDTEFSGPTRSYLFLEGGQGNSDFRTKFQSSCREEIKWACRTTVSRSVATTH